MTKKDVKFFPIDINYETSESEHITVNILGLTPKRKKVKVSDNFFPYFWAVIDSNNTKKLIAKIKKISKNIINVKTEKKKYLKKKVNALKISCMNTTDLKEIRKKIRDFEEVSETLGYDISLKKKYLIDRKIAPYTLCTVKGNLEKGYSDIDIIIKAEKIKQVSSDVIDDLRTLVFDLETLCEGDSPNPKEEPIIMCSFYGSSGFKKVVTWKPIKEKPEYVKIVSGEQELINEFIRTIKEYSPEILLGYGSDFFDFPYIKERAKKYNLKLSIGWENSEPVTRLRNRKGTTKIRGLNHIDIYKFIRNIIGRTLEVERYSLDKVGKEMTGISKTLSLKKENINYLWDSTEENLIKLVEYNLRDSEITYKIAEKTLPTLFQLSKLLNLTLFDINRMTYSQLVEHFLIKNSGEFNQLPLRRPMYNTIRERRMNTYIGGFVYKPEANIYEDIGSFDYRSLYPSLISAYNIGPTTINCKCCKSSEKIEIDGKDYWFCKKNEGFLSSLIRDLVERRKRIKKILKDTKKTDSSYQEFKALSYALKTLANASYGYLGFPGARWYCLECAKAITSLGRKYINKVIETSKEFGFEVIYADTDGAFILLKNKDKNINKFLKKINSSLPDPMELEYQGRYTRGLFFEKKSGGGGAKKRYALLSEDGEIILKGIEAIRGDWSPIAKKTQKKVIEIILNDKSVDKAAAYVKELIENLKKRRIDVEDLAIKATLTRDIKDYETRGPHVIAAEMYRRKGHKVSRGFTVSYVVCKGSGRIGDRIKLTEDAEKIDYDVDYYIDKQVIRAIYKIFDLFDYPIDKLKSGQSKLTNW